jgi:hypothetical protein
MTPENAPAARQPTRNIVAASVSLQERQCLSRSSASAIRRFMIITSAVPKDEAIVEVPRLVTGSWKPVNGES